MSILQKFSSPEIIQFKKIGTPTLGYISVAEKITEVPFLIKRVYWTYYTPNHVIRGHHAHLKLEQVIVAVSGVIEFDLESREGKVYHFKLENPSEGLYIPAGYWRVMRFSHSAVLLCLASIEYDEKDYIRDYNQFKKNDI